MIPVVDLRSDNAVAALRSACEEIGFFTVVGHGVSPAAIDEVAAVSRRFFDQTADAKERFAGPAASSVCRSIGRCSRSGSARPATVTTTPT